MIQKIDGDLFQSKAFVYVNPVNCVGVMGAGLAKQFKLRYPSNFTQYRVACLLGSLRLGGYLAVPHPLGDPMWIVNLPTKDHWRDRSTYGDIAVGLYVLHEWASEHAIPSLALPAVGCGLGGLEWERVRRLVELEFNEDPGLLVETYPPL